MDSGATPDDLLLGGEFPAVTREQWLALVRQALKDRPYERLVSKTADGIAIEPLYPRAQGAAPIPMRTGPWQVSQRIDLSDPVAANAEARHELDNGADALTLVMPGAAGDRGFAMRPDADSIARALEGVVLDAGIALDIDAGPNAEAVPSIIAELVRATGADPSRVQLRAGFDPLGAMARGFATPAWSETAAILAGQVTPLLDAGLGGPHVMADGRIIHDAGGSEAQELAWTLGAAVDYLRALNAGGLSLEAARRSIGVRVSADADQFTTIAKLRAMRKLWARVEEECGLAPAPLFVAAETAWRMMSRRDPWVNILRTTIATFAAGVGGADCVTVLPFTAALGLPDRFARRIARNTHLLLLEESNVAKVRDPAAGSGGIEHLTDALCGRAWDLFRRIEAEGGAHAALAGGLLQREVARVRETHMRDVAHRREPLTGASDYPLLTEADVAVLSRAPHSLLPDESGVAWPALRPFRLSEPFEALRDASDRALAQKGTRPRVFLANLGRLSDFTARQTFAKSFFEAGGIEAITNDGFESRDALLAAFSTSGATLACLCSSDAVYESEAADVARALAAAGASHAYLAGRPKDVAPYQAAGIGTFIFTGCDALSTLRDAHAMIDLGVEHPGYRSEERA